MIRRVILGFSIWVLAWLVPSAASAEPKMATDPSTAAMAAVCSGCHREKDSAHPPSDIPPLHTLGREQFIERFNTYRQDPTQGTAMSRLAKGYTNQEIALLAAYFDKVLSATPASQGSDDAQ